MSGRDGAAEEGTAAAQNGSPTDAPAMDERRDGDTIFVFGHVTGVPRIATLRDGSRLWVAAVTPEGAQDSVELRASGRTAEYLIDRDPGNGGRIFAVGLARHDARQPEDVGWYVALQAAATGTSADWRGQG
ncbi:hypothetical protein ACLUWO_04760 [Pseudoscardovia radai]|uniref:hypothetical protein n=1 Tax=Pseudoscardovia radai TaxID=987066 RepID=UPI003995D067